MRDELHQLEARRVTLTAELAACEDSDSMPVLHPGLPYRIHTVLTDNGTHFTEPAGDGWKPADIRRMRAAGELFRCHSFELACAELEIEHRLTKPNHPWTTVRSNG